MFGSVGLVLGVAMLTACAATPETPISRPVVTVSASPSSTLSALELRMAYDKYRDTEDSIGASGGKTAENLRSFVSKDQFTREKSYFDKIMKSGRRLEGKSALSSLSIQQTSPSSASAYVCVDYSNVRVLDQTGTDVTPRNRPNLQAFQVGFIKQEDLILVDSSETWSSNSVC